jgi:hypothetical protein
MNEMDETGEVHREIQQMRARARELTADAERTSNAEERERLRQEARKLEFTSEQESMMAAGDIYPAE